MMSFTAAYLLRLAIWGLAFAVFLGAPVWVSWHWWSRALDGASACARHRLACGHFLALLLLPGVAVGSVHLTLAAMGTEVSREPPPPWISPAGDGQPVGWLTLIITAMWMAGASLAALRLAAEAWRLYCLNLQPAPAIFAEEVRLLAMRLLDGRRLTVRVADVPVPQVTGVVNPVLVVPVGFVCLPTAEREAVLLHELAHVARSDFAVNLLHRFVLLALWFQPAAWALYRHVAREREACCDQLALTHDASALALAKALVRLAEDHLAPPVAMCVAGGGDFRWRVNRLLTPEKPVPPSRHWQTAALGALALVLSAVGGRQLMVADRAVTDLYIASVLGPVVSVSAHDPGGVFGLRIRRGHVLEATIEDRRLASTDIRQRGERVTLLGAAREPVVSLRVTPFGRIEWEARVAKTPRT